MPPKKSSVLVVDDIAENRDMLIWRLNRLGIKDIEQAANGLEALAAIERRAFDLMLLDIMMPELDGFGVLTNLKENGRVGDLPVIVISALSEIEPIVRCIELGAEDFIFKPFNPTLLRARVTATLEKKALRDQTREELRRKQVELNEARILQLALAPPNLRHAVYDHSIAIDVILEPAKEVGGDLVDYFLVADDLLVLVLGDVSDKGAGAALMMARTHALVRSLATRPDARALFAEPERATELVNRSLARQNDNCMFVTFCLATLDARSHDMRVVRAGHVPPLVRRTDGRIERLRAEGGLPLGLEENAVFKSESISLSPGDRLLIVTDGFTEAADREGAQFGDERVEAFLAELDISEPEPLLQLTRMVRTFEDGQHATDDIAAIMLSLSRAGDA